jgi:hypothetical protein
MVAMLRNQLSETQQKLKEAEEQIAKLRIDPEDNKKVFESSSLGPNSVLHNHSKQQRPNESESDMEEIQRRLADTTAKWKEAESKLLFLRNVMLSVVPMNSDSSSFSSPATTTSCLGGNDNNDSCNKQQQQV